MKTERWHFLDTGRHDAAWNMAADEVLLRNFEFRISNFEFPAPILRTYGWARPATSIGYFQKWSPVLAPGALTASGLADGRELVRRPTGGGLVEHGDGFTYSVILPRAHPLCAAPTLEIYRAIHEAVREALRAVGTDSTFNIQRPTPNAQRRNEIAQCFIAPTCYDLVSDGRKIAGAAIRKTKDGALVQGEVRTEGRRTEDLGLSLQQAFGGVFGARFEKLKLGVTLETEIRELARTKYGSEQWTRRFS